MGCKLALQLQLLPQASCYCSFEFKCSPRDLREERLRIHTLDSCSLKMRLQGGSYRVHIQRVGQTVRGGPCTAPSSGCAGRWQQQVAAGGLPGCSRQPPIHGMAGPCQLPMLTAHAGGATAMGLQVIQPMSTAHAQQRAAAHQKSMKVMGIRPMPYDTRHTQSSRPGLQNGGGQADEQVSGRAGSAARAGQACRPLLRHCHR